MSNKGRSGASKRPNRPKNVGAIGSASGGAPKPGVRVGANLTRLPYSGEGEGSTHSFWSYVRDDDRAIFGKIAQLREDIQSFYRFQTGFKIEIFMDRENVRWGQQWDAVISRGINTTVFLIPIVTPSFFQSSACRDELIRFDTLCRRRGLTELILPILLSGRDRVSMDSEDPVARIIASAQYRDFSEIWPAERGGEQWNRAVCEIVADLIDAERRAESQLSDFAVSQSDAADDFDGADDGDGDGPGIIELLAQVEPKILEITPPLEQAISDFNELSAALGRTPLGRLGGDEGQNSPRAFQKNIILSAQGFRAEAQKFEQSSAYALEKVREADSVMTPLRANLSKLNDATYLASFLQSMAGLHDVRNAAHSMNDVLVQMRDLEQMSSVLRKELRPARKGITYLRDAANITASWAE